MMNSKVPEKRYSIESLLLDVLDWFGHLGEIQ